MTNEEIIKALKELQLGCFIGSVPYLALEKAIEAIESKPDYNAKKEEYWWDIIEPNRSLVNDRFGISRFNDIVRCPKGKTIRQGVTYYCSWCGSKMKWNGMPSQSAEEGTYLVPEIMEADNGQSNCSSDRSDA